MGGEDAPRWIGVVCQYPRVSRKLRARSFTNEQWARPLGLPLYHRAGMAPGAVGAQALRPYSARAWSWGLFVWQPPFAPVYADGGFGLIKMLDILLGSRYSAVCSLAIREFSSFCRLPDRVRLALPVAGHLPQGRFSPR